MTRNAPLVRDVQDETALRGNFEADDRYQDLEEPGFLLARAQGIRVAAASGMPLASESTQGPGDTSWILDRGLVIQYSKKWHSPDERGY
jgi:hypothetical protein